MSCMKKYEKQFKLDAVKYYESHKDLGVKGCAENLGVSPESLRRWKKEFEEKGDLACRGSGNYSSDEAKEIAHLKRELKSAQDAIEVLKKALSIAGNP